MSYSSRRNNLVKRLVDDKLRTIIIPDAGKKYAELFKLNGSPASI